MTRLRHDQRGMTIPELLIAMSVMVIVLTATLTVFDGFQSSAVSNAKQNDSQDMARATVVLMSRQLRNLAGPEENQPAAFDAIGPYDIVFKTVNRVGPGLPAGNVSNVMRVRYCLDGSGRLWAQEQHWVTETPPAPPGTASCPDGSWESARVVAQHLVNTYAGAENPVFVFDSADPMAVNSVRMNLWVDTEPTRPPRATQLESGVFLRNQNRAPVADFQATPGAPGGHAILNASASFDPEGLGLKYTWKEGEEKICQDSVVVCDWATSPGAHTVTLEVRDPARLLATVTKPVTVAAS